MPAEGLRALHMIPSLNEIIGLPPAASPADLGSASELRYLEMFDRAAQGDLHAQQELVRLRVAYLNWAYAGQDARSVSACIGSG